MLVLSRKRREGIIIGQDITLTVLEIRGNQIKLGVEAPKKVAVLRAELVLGRRQRGAMSVCASGPGDAPTTARCSCADYAG